MLLYSSHIWALLKEVYKFVLTQGTQKLPTIQFEWLDIPSKTYFTFYHNGLFDSNISQTASPSHPGYSWLSLGQGNPPEHDSKGSGCDHEVLGMLEAKIPKTGQNSIKKCLFLSRFWTLVPPKLYGRTQNAWIYVLGIPLCDKTPIGTHDTKGQWVYKEFANFPVIWTKWPLVTLF